MSLKLISSFLRFPSSDVLANCMSSTALFYQHKSDTIYWNVSFLPNYFDPCELSSWERLGTDQLQTGEGGGEEPTIC